MAQASRVRVLDIFERTEWELLSARSQWIGLALVAHCWLVIALAMAIGAYVPLTIPIMIMIIGTRQLGLAVLMHDAAHGALHPSRWINDFVGEYLCTSGLARYRAYHLKHHRFAQQAEDPDLVLSAPFPITRASLWRKIVRDLTGQTYLKQRFGHVAARLAKRTPGESRPAIITAELWRMRRYLGTRLSAFALFCIAGYGWVWLVLWLVPEATWLPLVTRLRNIAEHALVAKDEADPFRHARTTHATWLERAFIAPYWVNFHCEHHLFMYVPCWRLPALHKAMASKGLMPKMLIAPGYFDVLVTATAKA